MLTKSLVHNCHWCHLKENIYTPKRSTTTTTLTTERSSVSSISFCPLNGLSAYCVTQMARTAHAAFVWACDVNTEHIIITHITYPVYEFPLCCGVDTFTARWTQRARVRLDRCLPDLFIFFFLIWGEKEVMAERLTGRRTAPLTLSFVSFSLPYAEKVLITSTSWAGGSCQFCCMHMRTKSRRNKHLLVWSCPTEAHVIY